MTKSLLAALIGCACMTGLAQAQALDNSWYLGGKAGWSHFYGVDYDGQIKEIVDLVEPYKQESDLGLGGFIGYQLNPNLGFELGYDWLGKYQLDKSASQGTESARIDGEAKAQMVQATMRISLPATPALDIYGRLGGAYAWTESAFSASYQDAANPSSNASSSSTGHKYHGAAFVGALGAEYAFNPSWALRLEYQYTTPLGNTSPGESGIELDNGLFALGLVYRFGQGGEEVVAASPAPAAVVPATVIMQQRFTLSSDVLFEFNKASLRPEANQALDTLFQQIVAANPQDGIATVVGHTDRLGADDYNQNLSELRARSVADALIGRGWPAEKMQVEGRGEREPITANQCNSGSKSELIVCLAPDRRVEVKLNGVGEGSPQ